MSYYGDIDYAILREENEQLKAQLEKAKCCGSCKWWCYFIDEEHVETECNRHGVYGCGPGWGCDKWEIRE